MGSAPLKIKMIFSVVLVALLVSTVLPRPGPGPRPGPHHRGGGDGGRTCYDGGRVRRDGWSGLCSDECNTCYCNNGLLSSTMMLCNNY